MQQKRWFKALRYYWQFQPFHLNFVLLMVLYFIIRYVTLNAKLDTSSFIGLILLMAKVVFVFAAVVMLFGLFSALLCWIWFLHKKSTQQPAILLELDAQRTKQGELKIHTTLPFALRPFLGYVKVRLRYDDGMLSARYRIERKKKGQWFFFQPGLESSNALTLNDIKEYHFQKAIVYFEDFLHLFSFASAVPVHDGIKNLPKAQKDIALELMPKKTEEEKVRIQQLRKVEGEYLNYKKFENSDDVRRIVWKIFAKNKELVVRVPEIMDPFSSHIYFYPSFYHTGDLVTNNAYHQAMLNYYKDWVFTLYEALVKKEFEVRYIQDQLIRDTQKNAAYSITLAAWHQDMTLTNFVKPQHASALCIHSFTDVQDLENILSSFDAQTKIYFVRLSASMRSLYFFHWLYRIFFIPAKDDLAKLKNRWPLLPLRYKTLKQEKKIAALLKQSECNFEILP